MECVEKIIKKDMIHPLTGQTLKEKDIITLQRGGTGYSATNDQLKATKYRPSSLLAWILIHDYLLSMFKQYWGLCLAGLNMALFKS